LDVRARARGFERFRRVVETPEPSCDGGADQRRGPLVGKRVRERFHAFQVAVEQSAARGFERIRRLRRGVGGAGKIAEFRQFAVEQRHDPVGMLRGDAVDLERDRAVRLQKNDRGFDDVARLQSELRRVVAARLALQRNEPSRDHRHDVGVGPEPRHHVAIEFPVGDPIGDPGRVGMYQSTARFSAFARSRAFATSAAPAGASRPATLCGSGSRRFGNPSHLRSRARRRRGRRRSVVATLTKKRKGQDEGGNNRGKAHG
jgi:hypothetical protein